MDYNSAAQGEAKDCFARRKFARWAHAVGVAIVGAAFGRHRGRFAPATLASIFSIKTRRAWPQYLAQWDKSAALPTLKKRLNRAWNIGAQPNDILAFNGEPVERFGKTIVELTLARARCGDLGAYDEYAAWLRKADVSKASWVARELLKPLVQGAARPSIGRVVDYLFNDPASAWSNVFGAPQWFVANGFLAIAATPLTQGFRKQALRGLNDKSPAGTITFNAREEWNSRTEAQIEMSGHNMGYRGSNNDAALPPAGEKRAFRVCDAYAYFYAQYRNGPKFQLFWPQSQRDAGIAKCRQWLQSR